MGKPGRPKKNGFQPIWMLWRSTLIIHAYDEARRAGQKHEAAIDAAVEFVKKERPGMPISKTEVRRTLASLYPRGQDPVLVISKPDPSNVRTLSDGLKVVVTYSGSLGPRPIYPRVNAVSAR